MNIKIQDKYKNWLTASVNDGKWSPHVTYGEISNPSSKENIILELPLEARLHRDCWEIWREWWGKPVTITSAYRTKNFNKAIGGASNSLHLKCCAYDCGIGQISDTLFKECYDVCFAIAKAYNTQCELGRYTWGLHIGFAKLSYTDKRVYTFDSR